MDILGEKFSTPHLLCILVMALVCERTRWYCVYKMCIWCSELVTRFERAAVSYPEFALQVLDLTRALSSVVYELLGEARCSPTASRIHLHAIVAGAPPPPSAAAANNTPLITWHAVCTLLAISRISLHTYSRYYRAQSALNINSSVVHSLSLSNLFQ